jgi:hypothetical protein
VPQASAVVGRTTVAPQATWLEAFATDQTAGGVIGVVGLNPASQTVAAFGLDLDWQSASSGSAQQTQGFALLTSKFGRTIDACLASLPVVAIDSVQVNEGNSGTTTLTFTLTLDAAPLIDATVAFNTADDTATAGSDYTASSGVVTFAVGETTKTVSIDVLTDLNVEPDETFFTQLSLPNNLLIGTSQASKVIFFLVKI